MNALGNRDSIDTEDVSAVPEQEELLKYRLCHRGGDAQDSTKVFYNGPSTLMSVLINSGEFQKLKPHDSRTTAK